jgi:hypothetical protein
MNAATKLSALNRFRIPAGGVVRQLTTKILVVYDVQIKNPEVPHVPLIINYGKQPPIPSDSGTRMIDADIIALYKICRRPSKNTHIGMTLYPVLSLPS